MNIEKALFWYMATLSILSVIAWQIVLIRGQFLDLGFPYNTFIFAPSAHFTDFTWYNKAVLSWLDNGTFGSAFGYFPVAAYVYLFFYYLYPSAPAYAYLLSLFLGVCIITSVLGYKLRYLPIARMFWATIILTVLTSYPFMFMFDRGNIEGVLWILLLLGVISFIGKYFFVAGFLFSLAASMKLYPIVFLLLFISYRKYKVFSLSIFILVIVSILASYGFAGGICNTVSIISKGLSGFISTIVLERQYLNYDHSLFTIIKQVIYILNFFSPSDRQMTASMFHYVYLFTVVGIFIILYVQKIRNLPFLNQLFAVVIACVFLPFISYDYTLIHLYIPWGLFMMFLAYDAESSGFTTKQALNILIPCAIIFTPQSYLIIDSTEYGIGGFGGQVKALVLLYLLIVVLKNPMPSNTLFKENYSKV